MKKLFLFLTIAFSVLSCNTSKTTTSNTVAVKPKTEYLNGGWQLQMLFASDNNWTNTPTINLNLSEKTFTGNSGCNSIRGKFTISDNYIAFDKNIITTKMACAGNFEKAFLDALLKINRFYSTKDELELGQGEIVIMKFKRTD